MTRVLVQRGSASSSSQNRAGSSSSVRSDFQVSPAQQVSIVPRDEDMSDDVKEEIPELEFCGTSENKTSKNDVLLVESLQCDQNNNLNDEVDNKEAVIEENAGSGDSSQGLGAIRLTSGVESVGVSTDTPEAGGGSPQPPPPPVPPPKPLLATNSDLRRSMSGSSNSARIASPRRATVWPVVSTRTSPSGSRPSSPRSHGESEGYNSADEQKPSFVSSYDDTDRERQFEVDIWRSKGFEVRRMLEDGNCLFRAVADQVYGDSEACNDVRLLCMDYMERERDHFSQFITEGFTSYCKRKRRDKVYGNNVEIQALSEMYNRPIHIYSYSTEPINIFHGSYNTDSPPIRLSYHRYHHGNHYNSLVDPRRVTIGAGLGFSSLQGRNVDKDQVKAAIKAQQDLQIDNALLAEGQFYSDLELTEKEMERMVMDASRAEYLAKDKLNLHVGHKEYSTSGAEPSSSGARPSGSEKKLEAVSDHGLQDIVLTSSVQMLLSMGFSYLQAIEAYSIFGDDLDSMVCYLLETSSGGRRKGKAAE